MLVYELITPNTVGLSPEQFLNSIAYKIWWYILTADTRRRWPPGIDQSNATAIGHYSGPAGAIEQNGRGTEGLDALAGTVRVGAHA